MRWIIFGVLMSLTGAFAQDLQERERLFAMDQNRVRQHQRQLDSLGLALDDLAGKIDQMKERDEGASGELETLLAQALSLTQEIQAEQSRLKERRATLDLRRRELEHTYSGIIDSLQQLNNGEEAIRRQILQIAEKKILISESVNSLSYDPQQVADISLSEAADSLEKRLLLDYLNNARNEVDIRLTEVQTTQAELRDILLLRERAAQFLQEVDNEGIVGFLQTAGDKSVLAGETVASETDAFRQARTIWSDQIQAYLSIAQQLEGSAVPLNMEMNLDAAGDLSPKDYLNLLDQIVAQLNTYRRIITQKLGKN